MTTPTSQQFTARFGLRLPIVQGAMGGVAGPRLVASVGNAGGLGILPIWARPPADAAALIAETQTLTDAQFAVNLRADLVQIEHIDFALKAGISWFHLFWGDPTPSMPAIKAGGGRLIATVGDIESDAHDFYKAALVNAHEADTVRTKCFDGMWPDAPHRVLKNSTYNSWKAAGFPSPGHRPGENDVILMTRSRTYKRYSMMPPAVQMTGQPEAAAMYAGCGVGRVADCPSVAAVISDLASLIRD